MCTVAAMACGDDGPPASTTTCTPTCSAGYTCVSAACVPVCDPPCALGQTCAVMGGVAACSGGAGDAGGDVPPGQDATPDGAIGDAAMKDASADAIADAAPDATVGPDATADAAPDVTSPPMCSPACSAGYTCVAGVCVARCNPVCGAGETCVVRDGFTVCLRTPVDAGADAPPVMDVPAAMDVPAMDRPPTTDAPPGMDAPPAMDAPADAASAPCGMTGQPCCGFDPSIPSSVGSCRGANLCDRTSRRCVAYTLEMNECTTTGECPAGQVCGLGEFCSGGTRSCLRCSPRVTTGALAAGAPCGGMITAPCADGICANGRCTRTCVPGAAGDSVCRSFSAGTVCAELQQSVRLDGGATSNPVTFGACIRSCRRDMDCADAAGNLRCGLSVRRLDDSLLQTCRVAFGTIAAGAGCPLAPTSGSDPMMYCQSGQCFSVPTSMTTGSCSAYCVTDADCPASAPACRDIPFFRPSGTAAPTQPIRMCERR